MRPSTRTLRVLARGIPVLLALTLGACKKSEPTRGLPTDAAEQTRPRPSELGHVTLKVVGMT